MEREEEKVSLADILFFLLIASELFFKLANFILGWRMVFRNHISHSMKYFISVIVSFLGLIIWWILLLLMETHDKKGRWPKEKSLFWFRRSDCTIFERLLQWWLGTCVYYSASASMIVNLYSEGLLIINKDRLQLQVQFEYPN